MLVKFKQFVDEITAENGRNYKISVLEKYKEDEDILYLLDFIYNPYITTGISTKSYSRFHNKLCIDNYPKNIFNSTRDALEYLKVHNTGDDNTRELMFSYYMNIYLYEVKTLLETGQSVDIHELFYYIITKNIQLGIDSKTINKVIPGLIPEFNVQLANKYFDKPEVVEGKEFVLTTKIDGSRIIAMKDNGKVSFWTRQGQKYEGLVDLEKDLLECTDDNFVFDGELVAIDTDLENTYKNTMKLSRTKELEKHGLKMLVFDYMPIANFKAQKCPIDYSTRRVQLSTIFGLNCFKYFELLPILYKGTDTSKIIEILNEQVAAKNEGIMLNICNAPYHFGRTSDLLKIKLFKDCDLIITGFEEGTNKLQGTLGALILDYKGNELRCGSGFTDEQRKEIWENRDQYLGKIAEIKYFEETKNQNGGTSLRFPIFKDIRTDKTEPNY